MRSKYKLNWWINDLSWAIYICSLLSPSQLRSLRSQTNCSTAYYMVGENCKILQCVMDLIPLKLFDCTADLFILCLFIAIVCIFEVKIRGFGAWL